MTRKERALAAPQASDDTCDFCLQTYAVHMVWHCTHCDRPICPVCAVEIEVHRRAVCPECHREEPS